MEYAGLYLMQMGLAHKGREHTMSPDEIMYLDILLSFCEEHEANLVIKPPDTSNDDRVWGVVLVGRKLGEKVEWGYLHNNLMFAGNDYKRVDVMAKAVHFCSSYKNGIKYLEEQHERNR